MIISGIDISTYSFISAMIIFFTFSNNRIDIC